MSRSKQEGERFTWLPGLSKSSLHAKTMAIDRKMMFVGSFNFDRRSLYISNEIGILFHERSLPTHRGSSTNTFSKWLSNWRWSTVTMACKRCNGLQQRTTRRSFSIRTLCRVLQKLEANMMRLLPIDSML
jgi:putative cardiolipin synthase